MNFTRDFRVKLMLANSPHSPDTYAMYKRPDITPLIGRELAVAPLPWNYVERSEAAHSIFEQVVLEHRDRTTILAAVAYSKWLRNTYLMPGRIANSWRTALVMMNTAKADKELFETKTGEEYDRMLETFETEHLGLPRVPSGSRWWPSNAGGGGSGSYPTEAIATVMNMPTKPFLEYIRQNKTGCGYILAKSDVYLFAVTDTSNDQTVNLDHINHLSKSGDAFLEGLLVAFAAGQEYGLATPPAQEA